MQVIHIERQVLALTDDQLEQFVREWTTHKKEYIDVQRFTGPADMGRDVVGYLTNQRHEGSWIIINASNTLELSQRLSDSQKSARYFITVIMASSRCRPLSSS